MTAVLEPVHTPKEQGWAKHAQRTWLQVMPDLHPRYGGVSAAVPEMVQALPLQGIHAPIAALCHTGEQHVPATLDVSAVHFLPRARTTWSRRAPREQLAQLIRESDGVHVHGLWTAATHMVSTLASHVRRPYCVSAHGMLEPWALRQRRVQKLLYAALLEKRVMRGAACLQALTAHEAEAYRALAPHVPVVVIPNGVAVPLQLSAEAFLCAYPHLRGRRIVLFLARMHAKKGVDVLLRAWRNVTARKHDAHLVLAGTGDPKLTEALHLYCAEHGLQESVTFTGLLSGELKWSALSAAECLVLPSYSEGLSVAILEALGAGTPVLATPQCNMPELQSFGCGWLTTPEEAPLRDALESLLERTPQENARAGERGRLLVQRRYTWAIVSSQLTDVYRWMNGASLPTSVEVLR